MDESGSTFYPTYDGNGNIMGYVDLDSGVSVAEFEYGPFGELIRATGSKVDQFDFCFSTKYQDAETGLLYYGYRYYDAVTGRWLNRDPIEERSGLNLYGMVENNIVNQWDILGQVPGFIKNLFKSATNRIMIALAAQVTASIVHAFASAKCEQLCYKNCLSCCDQVATSVAIAKVAAIGAGVAACVTVGTKLYVRLE